MGVYTNCAVYVHSFSHTSFPTWILFVGTLIAYRHDNSLVIGVKANVKGDPHVNSCSRQHKRHIFMFLDLCHLSKKSMLPALEEIIKGQHVTVFSQQLH